MTLKQTQQRMELVHQMKEQLAMGAKIDNCWWEDMVKKRPGGIQLTCLHMTANDVILKMR
jgi:hypothetical protein